MRTSSYAFKFGPVSSTPEVTRHYAELELEECVCAAREDGYQFPLEAYVTSGRQRALERMVAQGTIDASFASRVYLRHLGDSAEVVPEDGWIHHTAIPMLCAALPQMKAAEKLLVAAQRAGTWPNSRHWGWISRRAFVEDLRTKGLHWTVAPWVPTVVAGANIRHSDFRPYFRGDETVGRTALGDATTMEAYIDRLWGVTPLDHPLRGLYTLGVAPMELGTTTYLVCG